MGGRSHTNARRARKRREQVNRQKRSTAVKCRRQGISQHEKEQARRLEKLLEGVRP